MEVINLGQGDGAALRPLVELSIRWKVSQYIGFVLASSSVVGWLVGLVDEGIGFDPDV